jgi:hypothetical protein
MEILFNLFPNGLKKALTMSYDDGQVFDIRLVELFDKHGIRGTFHLNSGRLDTQGFISSEEVKTKFKNHEISAHSTTHPFLDKIPAPFVVEEMVEDRKNLEQLVNYPVRGMSYPFGTYSEEVINTLKSVGIEYSRTVNSTNNFDVPLDFMKWDPTCHHNGDLDSLWERFVKDDFHRNMRLFYIWGHSFEFDRNDNWNVIEAFCEKAGGRDDIWYATNIEIVDYVNAVRSLKFSVDKKIIINKSAIDVCLTINDEAVCIKAGATYYKR